jgi:hypothetical protein
MEIVYFFEKQASTNDIKGDITQKNIISELFLEPFVFQNKYALAV